MQGKLYIQMKSIIVLILSVSLTACFPIYKTQKPEAEVTILDENGQPLANVKVMLVTEVHPAKVDGQFDSQTTDQSGKVVFTKQAEWKVESLIIHGMQYYDWKICVSKSGYLTQEFIRIKSDAEVKIVLKKGNNPKREFPYYC